MQFTKPSSRGKSSSYLTLATLALLISSSWCSPVARRHRQHPEVPISSSASLEPTGTMGNYGPTHSPTLGGDSPANTEPLGGSQTPLTGGDPPTGTGALPPTNTAGLGPAGTDKFGGDTGSITPTAVDTSLETGTAVDTASLSALPTDLLATVGVGDTAGQQFNLPSPVPALDRQPHDGNGTLELEFQRNNMSIHLGMKAAQWRKMYLANEESNKNFSGKAHMLAVFGAGIGLMAGGWAAEKLWARHTLNKQLSKWHTGQDTKFLEEDKNIDWSGIKDPEKFQAEIRADARKFNKFREKQMKQMRKKYKVAEDKLNDLEAADPKDEQAIKDAKEEMKGLDDSMDKLDRDKFSTNKMEKMMARREELMKELHEAKDGSDEKFKLLAEQEKLEEDMAKGGWEGDAKTGLTAKEARELRIEEFSNDPKFGGEPGEGESERGKFLREKKERHMRDAEERTREDWRVDEEGNVIKDAEGKDTRTFGEKSRKLFRVREEGNTMKPAEFENADMRKSLEEERMELRRQIDMIESDEHTGFFDKWKHKFQKKFTSQKALEDLRDQERTVDRRLKNIAAEDGDKVYDSEDLLKEEKLETKIGSMEKEMKGLESESIWKKMTPWKKAEREERFNELKTESEEARKELEDLKSEKFGLLEKEKQELEEKEENKVYREDRRGKREQKAERERKAKEREAKEKAKEKAREREKAGDKPGGAPAEDVEKDLAEKETGKMEEAVNAVQNTENTMQQAAEKLTPAEKAQLAFDETTTEMGSGSDQKAFNNIANEVTEEHTAGVQAVQNTVEEQALQEGSEGLSGELSETFQKVGTDLEHGVK